MFSDDSYNKFTNKGPGTLVGNWYEERTLRETTGTSRATLPQSRGDTSATAGVTFERVHGERRMQPQQTTNAAYGGVRVSNSGSGGRRQQFLEEQIAAQVLSEVAESKDEEQRRRDMMYLDTTYRNNFTQQDMTANKRGYRFMTQEGEPLPADTDFMAEIGTGTRKPKKSIDELRGEVPPVDYAAAVPVTVWSEKLKDRTVSCTAPGGANPFGRNSGFSQPIGDYVAGSNYKDKDDADIVERLAQTSFDPPKALRVTMTQRPSNIDALRQRVRDTLLARAGSEGIVALGRAFRAMDDNGNKTLDRAELKYGLKERGVSMAESELDSLMGYFDRNRDGKVSFDEFMRFIRGDLNQRRRHFVQLAFAILDKTGDGLVTVEDIAQAYDASFHPDVQSGRKTKEEVFADFLQQWDTVNRDGIVTMEEFEEYYKGISCSIDTDDYFELMMRNCWHIEGGEGAMANTTIKRVLKTNADGTEQVVLGENKMTRHLRK